MESDNAQVVKNVVYGVVALGVLAGLYFGIIRPITNATGLTKTKDERKGDRDEEKLSKKQLLSPYLFQKYPELKTMTKGEADTLAYQIHKGDGYYDNESLAVGSIKQAKTKVNLSYLADRFQTLYNSDLHSFLEGTGYVDYLEEEHWSDIENYISKLPLS